MAGGVRPVSPRPSNPAGPRTALRSSPAAEPDEPELRIVVLCGGLGGARMALALKESGLDFGATFITNVADDVEVGPYLVCPDTDAVLYALSGRFDEERGWGVAGDHFGPPPEGAPAWFGLGELDLATHRTRRALLDSGATLGQTVKHLLEAHAARASIVPATNDPLRTMVRCDSRWLTFQEWLVRDHATPTPDEVRLTGANVAQPAPGVLSAIDTADLVVLAPSSPIASLLPTLRLPGIWSALAARQSTVVAISSLVQRHRPTCDRDIARCRARDSLLAAVGVGPAVPEIAAIWADIAGTFVLDPDDSADLAAVSSLGYEVVIAPTRADSPQRRRALIEQLLLLMGRST